MYARKFNRHPALERRAQMHTRVMSFSTLFNASLCWFHSADASKKKRKRRAFVGRLQYSLVCYLASGLEYEMVRV